ncbi:MAG TPA: M28 family metallopeptidase [Burkholderiales bacterium]|nr:M28 family metallopeptidase [Burkholderiales bacterium]
MRFGLVFFIACATLAAQPAIRGFSSQEAKTQRERESKLRAIPRVAHIRSYMQRMSSEPHVAGSPQSKAVAEYALGLMKEWGLEARIEEFEALLPYPTRRALEMTSPVAYKAKLHEPAIAEDRDSADKGQPPTYNAYAATANVTAPLIYVNYGIPDDYQQLAKLGISAKGKIVIARYGKSWRGTKAKTAQENGAVGCLIYSDPRDDGYFQGDVYPKGPFRPRDGVQRGSVMDMPLYVGDPLTPGWASEKGSRRLPRNEAATLMKIPVLPISYADAQPLLENLTGPVAPEAWRGALPVTYHVGPGPATVRLEVDFDWTTKPLYNVIATIPGTSAADEWLIYGNHHDAWVNGAADPVSGAATVLETARALAELSKSGWRPRRTIRFALWDGEEFGLIGSTEWVEKHRPELLRKAVMYLNSDTTGIGTLNAGGSPSLQIFFSEVLRDIQDPVKKQALLEGARARRAEGEQGDQKDKAFRLGPLGAGSDYVAFLHHTGIASINAGFSGGDHGGVYHSIYDSFDWYTKFSDKDFVYGATLAQVMATTLLRMADAPLLPFEFLSLAGAVERYVEDLKTNKQFGSKISLDSIGPELQRLKTAAAAFEKAAAKANTVSDGVRSRVNQALIATERAWLLDAGLPGRPWYKHQLVAPGLYTGYSAKTLPRVREAAEAGRLDEANKEAKVLADAIRAVSISIEDAAKAFE